MQVEDANQQKGSGDENPGEQLGDIEALQTEVPQASQMEKIRGNRKKIHLRLNLFEVLVKEEALRFGCEQLLQKRED